MSTPGGTGANNPFMVMLNDLLSMMSAGGNDPRAGLAFALQIATGGVSEPNVEPVVRIRTEELTRIAELHVTQATGLPLSPDGRRVSCVPATRGDWVARTFEGWAPLIDALATAQAGPTAAGAPPAVGLEPAPGTDGVGPDQFTAMFEQWMAMLQPMLLTLQIGSVVGHLAERALGPYVLPLPAAPGDDLLLVTRNIESYADDWSVPFEEALLWVASRELAAHSVLARPHVRSQLVTLVADAATAAAVSTGSFLERLSSMEGLDPAALSDPTQMGAVFGGPDALLGDLLSPEARRWSEALTAAALAVDAYADHIARRVGRNLVSSTERMAEAWLRRRIEPGKGEQAAAALFGIDLSREQIERGRAFVDGIVERAGEDALGDLWTEDGRLPTPAEMDAPGLWLERVALERSGVMSISDEDLAAAGGERPGGAERPEDPAD